MSHTTRPSSTPCSVPFALAVAVIGTALLPACSEDEQLAPLPQPTATGGGSQGGGGSGSDLGGSGGSAGSAGSAGAEPACPTDPLPAGEHQFTIPFDGHDREYEVQVPISYDNTTAVPLLFDLHALTYSKDIQQQLSGFDEKAEDEGFVVVRPNGYGTLRSWNGGDWCCGAAHDEDLDDVGLMRAIVQETAQRLCVDPRRVYATGLSNGGALSHRLACDAADLFAAVAPVSYPLDFDPFATCQPSRAVSVMHLHGTNDLIVPYDGSASAAATPDSFAYWAQVNGCTGDPEVTYSKGDSVCETYTSCDAGVQVALCSINGGHHLYGNLDDVPVTDLAWQFLSSHTLP